MAGEAILIVDDEEGIRSLLTRLLESDGYQVTAVGDGETAIALLEERRFNVGIVDLVLPAPITSGLDVLRRAKELDPDSEIVILTGYGNLETAVQSLRLGAYDYLTKPIEDLQLILLTVSRALERQGLSRSNRELVQQVLEANQEIERRRRQQIEHIRQIGQALTGALRLADVARVLATATLGAVDCDCAAVLVLPRKHLQSATLAVAAPGSLPDRLCQQVERTILSHMPDTWPLDPGDIETICIAGSEEQGREPGDNSNDQGSPEFGLVKFQELSVRDELFGIAMLGYDSDACSQVDLDVFGILAAQGSVALQNAYLFTRMTELATRDSLTGLFNHGHIFELLDGEISRAERHSQELAVIMLDVDRANGLKVINDSYGHQAGDSLLVQTANLLMQNVRRADAVARYGGDEFIIVAPQTGRHHAVALGERICRTIREFPYQIAGHDEHISVSTGVAIFHPGSSQTGNDIVSEADASLYLAKGRGGDQVAIIEAFDSV